MARSPPFHFLCASHVPYCFRIRIQEPGAGKSVPAGLEMGSQSQESVMKSLQLSSQGKGRIGLVGHVGIAHAHGAGGFQQDDSVGFSVVGSLLARALDVDTRIAEVSCTTEEITVRLASGGESTTCPRRRVSPCEAELMRVSETKDALFSQAVTAETFGRVYGQGAAEVPACFQAALSLAVLDSFKKAAPEKITIVPEHTENAGAILGTVLEIDEIPFSVVIPVNFSPGGIGPDEDCEGGFMIGRKGEMMKSLGFPLPTIVVESKVFNPLFAGIDENKFLLRVSPEKGDTRVSAALKDACRDLGLPCLLRDDLFPYDVEGFRGKVTSFADRLEGLASDLRTAEVAADKVRIVAELARMVSEDAAGFTFMSNDVYSKAESPGLEPGTSAVLSMVVTEKYIQDMVIPLLNEKEREGYLAIVMNAIARLGKIVK